MERPIWAAKHHAAHAVPACCTAAHLCAQALVEGQVRCCAHSLPEFALSDTTVLIICSAGHPNTASCGRITRIIIHMRMCSTGITRHLSSKIEFRSPEGFLLPCRECSQQSKLREGLLAAHGRH
jgi:hypothetical protein